MRFFFVIALTLLLPACAASVPMATADADAQGKSFRPPPPGQGALYVYRDSFLGRAVPVAVSVSDRPLGFLKGYSWFRVDLDPGRYEVRCTSKENTEFKIIDLAADQMRFAEITFRIGVTSPRCSVLGSSTQEGRAGVVAGHRAAEQQVAVGVVATPTVTLADGPISMIYRDQETDERRMNGTARYGAVRNNSAPFTISNDSGETACNGAFSWTGPNRGKFTLSCPNFSGNGSYERKTSDPNNFIARGQTSKGYPITLIVGPNPPPILPTPARS